MYNIDLNVYECDAVLQDCKAFVHVEDFEDRGWVIAPSAIHRMLDQDYCPKHAYLKER